MGKNATRRRRQKEEKRAQNALQIPSSSPPRRAPRITANYGDPDTLIRTGPVIPGTWSVPKTLADHLERARRVVPAPVGGYLLVDTGASHTCIAQDVAVQLGLRPVRIGQSYGAHGLQKNEIFEAQLTLELADSFGKVHQIVKSSQVAGVPNLNNHWSGVSTQSPVPDRLIGLCGRDFLRHATLTYGGAKGSVEIVMDLSSMPNKGK